MRVQVSLSVIFFKSFMEKSWHFKMSGEFKKFYMRNLYNFLNKELKTKTIYPKFDDVFNCFKITPFDKVRVVILGQDPYCGENQAHGLAFSVLPGCPLPGSLTNVYKELYDDLGILVKKNGCLIKWAKQGILLLNSILTVESGKPGSHTDIGWELFTNKVIKTLSGSDRKIIFVLWGKQALLKQEFINFKKHYLISSSHPSSKSAFKGFLGSRPFSKINMHLKLMGEHLIDWNLE